LLALGGLGSQAGHLLAYELRFGGAAFSIQSSGVHAYFPTLAKTGLGLLAAAALSALLVVGLARWLAVRGRKHEARGPSYLGLLAALYTIQLAVFAGQETVEAELAGVQAGSIATILLWGTIGQLPVAVLAALALRWLATRFEAAVEELWTLARLAPPIPRVIAALAKTFIATEREAIRSQVARSALHKRGPPSVLRVSPA